MCTTQIARLLTRQTPLILDQSNLFSTRRVRQLILNTPEKAKILEFLYRDYDELNYAIRLPVDFLTFTRCSDRHDDHLPQFCQKPTNSTDVCFETSGLGFDHICLNQINCDNNFVRLACEFTLPGLTIKNKLKKKKQRSTFQFFRDFGIEWIEISTLS